ncbi:hypothetical protein ABIE78_003077 [Sinorhizobium fredii]|uniref:hypothetical protein n=1 Tax=Rhizobium fredii TaxID=380 RepID=UPI00030DADA5|nr:hypothetical protein [Sinorhizobium fredii]
MSEWLDGFAVRTFDGPETDYVLLPHCTERTNAQDSVRSWGAIFETFGLTLSVEGRRLLRHGGDLRA